LARMLDGVAHSINPTSWPQKLMYVSFQPLLLGVTFDPDGSGASMKPGRKARRIIYPQLSVKGFEVTECLRIHNVLSVRVLTAGLHR